MGISSDVQRGSDPYWRYMLALVLAILIAFVAVTAVVADETHRVSTFPLARIKMKPAVPVPKDATSATSPECPQMTNPGGGLLWQPSAQPGPVPTNGSVQLTRLGVNAPIVRVGIDGNHKMVVPGNAREVAWLDQGGIPGRTQNIVLAGHISYSGALGSFYRLGQLRAGDEIVLAVAGHNLRFRVVWNCSFARETEYAEQIMGYTTAPSLTLISCGGVFDTAARTHTNRIAVRAELIGGLASVGGART